MDAEHRRVLVVTVLASGLAFLDLSSINVLLPILQDDFDTSLAAVQWVVEGFVLMVAALLLVGGALGDRFGRKRILRIGVLAFAVASAGAGAAPGIGWLVAARVAQGIAAALVVPASLALITDRFPAEERGGAFGIWAAMTGLTAAGGPVLAGWLADAFTWRVFFFINPPIALFIAWYAGRMATEGGGEKHLDLVGAALAVLGLGGLTFGLVESGRNPWGEPLVWGPLVAGAVALGAFFVVEHKKNEPMLPLGLFRVRAFAGGNAVTLFLYAALGGVLFFVPFNLIQVQDWSATAAGAATVPMALVMTFLSGPMGRLADKKGARTFMVSGSLVTAAAYALLIVPGRDASYWTTFFPGFTVLGIGMALLVPALTASVMSAVPAEHRGTASGVNNTVARAAGLLAIAGFGAVAVAVFQASLPDALRAALGSETSRLAALDAPPGFEQAAIDAAFVAAFRVIAAVSCILALMAAAVAWRTAPTARQDGDEQNDEGRRGEGKESPRSRI